MRNMSFIVFCLVLLTLWAKLTAAQRLFSALTVSPYTCELRVEEGSGRPQGSSPSSCAPLVLCLILSSCVSHPNSGFQSPRLSKTTALCLGPPTPCCSPAGSWGNSRTLLLSPRLHSCVLHGVQCLMNSCFINVVQFPIVYGRRASLLSATLTRSEAKLGD